MPFKIFKVGKRFKVRSAKGRTIGTHPSRRKALRQLKALYADPKTRREARRFAVISGSRRLVEKEK